MSGINRRQLLALGAGLAVPALLSRVTHAADDNLVTFAELYLPGTVEISPRLAVLANKTATVRGFMAPPLKPDANFFVLTSLPMAACPFCETELTWPDNIIVVYTKGIVRATEFDRRIGVTGTVQLGTDIDKETGFLSRVRLIDATYSRIAA